MNTWKLLDDFVTRGRLELPQKAAFWPSMASVVLTDKLGSSWIEGKCMRASFYNYVLQINSPVAPDRELLINPTAYSQWVWRMGKAAENIVIEEFKKSGMWTGNNIKYYDDLHNISGELDSTVYDPEEEVEFVAEIKSIYGYYAQKQIIGTDRNPGFPRWSNLLQLALYLDFLRALKDKYPYGKLLYIDRGDMSRKEYKVRIIGDQDTPEEERYVEVEGQRVINFTMKDIYDRYRVLNDYIEAGKLPPNDYVIKYTDEQIETLYEQGRLGKTKYNKWKKPTKNKQPEHPGGDWSCQRQWCSYSGLCWPEGK